MTLLRVFVPVLIVSVLSSPIKERSSLSVYETAQNIAAQGYPVETHHVTTSDGYILEMHRIPYGRNQVPSANRPVVFLMHGLMSASNAYIILGPDNAPAYNLADAGFDIWMGNARGNKNSRAHVTLNPDDETQKFDFFNYSFEEIGIYDLPAMIDFALNYTGQEKLHYIGHSQGGTVFFVMNSMRPEYNEKIASAHLLAGVGYMDYFPDAELAGYASMTDFIYLAALSTGFVEVNPPSNGNEVNVNQRTNQCTGNPKTAYMCELTGINRLMRVDVGDLIPDFLQNSGSGGGALKQVAHYGQNIRDKAFRRWSYGDQNEIFYGTPDPPAYDLSLITANVTMHYTVNDNLLDERDVLAMANDMPNTSVRKVARETFLHSDFVVALDAKELVTDYIIEALRRDSGVAVEEEVVDQDSNENVADSTTEDNVIAANLTSSAHIIVFSSIVIYTTVSLVLMLV